MRAIGGAAVVNRLARFYLDNRGAWIGAATQPIAGKPARYKERAYPNTVASSLGCETGRRTVAWIRIAGAATQPIATKVCSVSVGRSAGSPTRHMAPGR